MSNIVKTWECVMWELLYMQTASAIISAHTGEYPPEIEERVAELVAKNKQLHDYLTGPRSSALQSTQALHVAKRMKSLQEKVENALRE